MITQERWLTVTVALASLSFGYSAAVMSGIIHIMKDSLHLLPILQGLLVGIFNISCVLGSLFGGYTGDKYGRKLSLRMSCVLMIVGSFIAPLRLNFALIFIGRVLQGFGAGMGLLGTTVYVSEISSPDTRGTNIAMTDMFMGVGILLGYAGNLIFEHFDSKEGWRGMFLANSIPAFILLVALYWYVPESPRWLLANGQEEEAKKVIDSVYEDQEVEKRPSVETIMQYIKVEMERDSDGSTIGWLMDPTPSVKLIMFIGIGLQIFQQLVGSEVLLYYTPAILAETGLKKKKVIFLLGFFMGLVRVISMLPYLLLNHKYGRRNFFFASSIGMLIGMVMIITALHLPKKKLWQLAFTGACVFLTGFSLGWGPCLWTYQSEIYPAKIRARAFGFTFAINKLSGFLIITTWPVLAVAIKTANLLTIYLFFTVCSIFFVWRYIPETKGKSLEEVNIMFMELSREEQVGGADLDYDETESLIKS